MSFTLYCGHSSGAIGGAIVSKSRHQGWLKVAAPALVRHGADSQPPDGAGTLYGPSMHLETSTFEVVWPWARVLRPPVPSKAQKASRWGLRPARRRP